MKTTLVHLQVIKRKVAYFVHCFFQRHISRDVNPVIQQWMVGISSQETSSLLASISVPVSSFERFIVRRSAMEKSPSGESSDNSYMSADEAPQAKAKEVPACNGHAEEVSMDLVRSHRAYSY